ncbi:MAG: glycosyltransferase family 2 protein [Mediterranea sp.]|jgi:GT2 family glycosyltransferase|nr:glycosyltransferase family 2 protein [Mediterranea sp.]
MKVLVIIVSYNFERWITPCLNSLRSSDQPVSVLVIDNDSTDHTVERIRTEYPEVQLIENKENLGFGAANNLGFQKAIQEDYDFVFLLNQDAWIDSQVIGTLSELSLKHPQYGVWSPVHINGKGEELDRGFATYAKVASLKEIPSDSEFVECNFINAAFWLIPTDVLQTVGKFSPLFYHYGEDKDYINRVLFHGYQTAYVPRVFGFHDRENRAVDRNGFFRSEEVYLLSEYANINYSFHKAFRYSILAGIQKALKALGHKKFKDCASYISICYRLIKKTRYIHKTRRKNILSTVNYI